MADLPIVRALMTTRHAATIQDASAELWQTAGSDLLVLADRSGNVMAVQSSSADLERIDVQERLSDSLSGADRVSWWFCGKHLFEVATRPIYLGDSNPDRLIGFLAIGSEIDDKVTRELSAVAASKVAFRAGGKLVRSTLSPAQKAAIDSRYSEPLPLGNIQEIQLDNEKFLAEDVQLSAAPGNVRLTVLKSLDQSSEFLIYLDRLVLELGALALLMGAGLVWT